MKFSLQFWKWISAPSNGFLQQKDDTINSASPKDLYVQPALAVLIYFDFAKQTFNFSGVSHTGLHPLQAAAIISKRCL